MLELHRPAMSASPSSSEECATAPSANGQLDGLEYTRSRRETRETFDSSTTFMSLGKCETADVHALDVQPSTDRSNASNEALAVDGKRVCTGLPGTWQRFSIRWLTAYRVLIFTAITINVAALIAQLVINPSVEAPLIATAANITTAVLLRQEDLINISFALVSNVPRTLPLSVRRTIADFHHYGGLHVGCALSALLWYIAFTTLNTARVLAAFPLNQIHALLYINVITAYTALLTILAICLTSLPRFRIRFHNTFEATHRFGGWAAIVTLWIHAGISALASHTPLHTVAPLYLLILTTTLLIMPWLRIRYIDIAATPLSANLLQISLPHSTPHTSTLRLSTSPWTQWHAFATIPASTSKSSTLLISKAGDWTASLLASPPEKIWIRNPPVRNFLSFTSLFASVLLVATGAGIGPILSLLSSPNLTPTRIRIMWCVTNPHADHWAFALGTILAKDPNALILDSRQERVDLGFEATCIARRDATEAVFVVGNSRVTRSVVQGCAEAGIGGFGAVFDS